MDVFPLTLSDVKKIVPRTFSDERGFFRETFRFSEYAAEGIGPSFLQDNHSFSKRGVIRGMHFQRRPGQAKLVSVASGRIFDVVVDVRKDSPSYGRWEGVYLDSAEGAQLWIPVGFAHGFCVVSDEAHVVYKVSSLYDGAEEMSFRYNDPSVGIEWPCSEPILSERDRRAPYLQELS